MHTLHAPIKAFWSLAFHLPFQETDRASTSQTNVPVVAARWATTDVGSVEIRSLDLWNES